MNTKLCNLIIICTFLPKACLNQPDERSSLASLLPAKCLPNNTPIRVTVAVSILQCQHFCTANEKCNNFVIKETDGVKTCWMYDVYHESLKCETDESLHGYSLTRKRKISPTNSDKNEDSCKAGTSTSIHFPRFSETDYVKAKILNSSYLFSFTVAFWAKTIENHYGSVLFTYQAGNNCCIVEIRTTAIGFSIQINGKIVNMFAPKINQHFTHYGLSWSSESTKMKLYVNGTLANTHTLTNQELFKIKGGGNAYLGVGFTTEEIPTSKYNSHCTADKTLSLKGEISQAFMWNKELSLQSIINAKKSQVECQGLVLRWVDFLQGKHGNVHAVPFIKE